MKKHFIYSFCITLFILSIMSCSNEISCDESTIVSNNDIGGDDESVIMNKLLSPSKVDISEAQNVLGNLFNIHGVTRSANSNDLNCIVITTQNIPLLPNKYLDVLPDTLAYIFYNSGNSGFIVVSADNRTQESILAVNDADYADSLDFENNSKDALWIANIVENEYKSITDFESKRDSVQKAIISELLKNIPDISITRAKDKEGSSYSHEDYYFVEYNSIEGDWEIDVEKLPLLNTIWGQTAPYNVYVKTKIPGDSALTGCVVTATAQLAAYWQFPSVIHGTSFDWYQVTQSCVPYSSYSIDRTGLLMKYIGEDIGTEYTPGGSSADMDNAYNWLINQGYSGMSSQDYSTEATVSSIISNRPVLICGYSTKVNESILGITYNTYYTDGHAWIVDGYRKLKRRRHHTIIAVDKRTEHETVILDDYYYEYCKLLHNNWGWEGYLNGWFVAGNFDAYNPSTINITRGSSSNYQYQLRIYPNICPNN